MCFTYLFLRHAVLRRQLQNSHCIYFKGKKIGRFEGLPQFKWTDREGQDAIGQGSFGAVFVTQYNWRKDEDSPRIGETVVVKKLLGSSLDFVDALAKEARLLYDLTHENIVSFKAVCHDPVALMLEYVYFDLSVFGGEGQVSSLKDFMGCLDTHNCEGIEGSFMKDMNKSESFPAPFRDLPFFFPPSPIPRSPC